MLTGAIMTTRAPNKTIAYILNPINARVGIRLLAALIDLYRATGDVAPGSALFIIFRLMSKVMVATDRIIPIPHQVSVASMVVFPFQRFVRMVLVVRVDFLQYAIFLPKYPKYYVNTLIIP
jgi:hypothetical protein